MLPSSSSWAWYVRGLKVSRQEWTGVQAAEWRRRGASVQVWLAEALEAKRENRSDETVLPVLI